MFTTDTKTLKGRLGRNGNRGCIHCGAPRVGFSHYCAKCKGLYYRWGHPSGRGIKPEDYSGELHLVRKLVEKNIGKHEGLQLAVGAMEKVLENAPLLSNHVENGVDGKTLLVELAAVYTFSQNNPKADYFMGGWKALYIQMSHAAINLISKNKRPMWATPSKKENLGWGLYSTLKPVLVSIAATVAKANKEREEVRKKMEAPLEY